MKKFLFLLGLVILYAMLSNAQVDKLVALQAVHYNAREVWVIAIFESQVKKFVVYSIHRPTSRLYSAEDSDDLTEHTMRELDNAIYQLNWVLQSIVEAAAKSKEKHETARLSEVGNNDN